MVTPYKTSAASIVPRRWVMTMNWVWSVMRRRYCAYRATLTSSSAASIKYTDGQVIYNGHFVANYTDSGSSYTADHHRTLRLVWEDGIWKVDAFSLLPDGAYSSTTYAPLP